LLPPMNARTACCSSSAESGGGSVSLPPM